MKNRSGEKIKLASIDELLGVVNEESAMEIEISKIHPFKNHPFKVLDDEKMQDLVESVKINGVLTPVLLRMDENEEYEMVSGHRRMHAAQLAGLTTIPAIVRELSDDDAIVAMWHTFTNGSRNRKTGWRKCTKCSTLYSTDRINTGTS